MLPMAMGLDEVVVTASRRAGAPAQAVQSDLGDYKLYTLPSPTTVAARQMKQVAFLDREAVPFERVYVFQTEGLGDDVDGRLMLRLQNTKAGGLDVPLPSGTVTLRQPGPAGSPLLIGERPLEDTSIGLPVELPIAAAGFSPRVQAAISPPDGRLLRYAEKTVVMTNPKPLPVVVEFRQDMGRVNARLLEENSPHTNRDRSIVWRFELAPGATRTLRYAVEME